MDAVIIHGPTSTRNEKRERDPEMHQTRKGNQWSFGMKVHVGVDKDAGLIHSVATRAANSSDVVVASELLHGEEKVVYGAALNDSWLHLLQHSTAVTHQDLNGGVGWRFPSGIPNGQRAPSEPIRFLPYYAAEHQPWPPWGRCLS